MEEKQITLDATTVQFIIDKLEALKEIDELNLTDWFNVECTEDRMHTAKNYIECGNLIQYLKETLYGN
jgi:hypothetical protein